MLMSDPAASSSAAPPPLTSVAEEGRGSSMTASPPCGHVASSSSTGASAGTQPSQPSLSPPSLPSSTSRAPPSVSASASGSRTATLTATSPPSTTGAASITGTVPGGPGSSSAASMSLNPNLPTRSSQLHIDEARAALVASVSNMLDSELQSRASLLHANASALSKQERDVAKAAEALRKENDKLAKVAKDAGRRIKELGNVQNWAEVLERDFLVLEETMRLVRDGGEGSDDGESCSECSGSYWSGSESEGGGEGESEGRKSREGSPRGSHRGSVNEERTAQEGAEENGKREHEDGHAIKCNNPAVNETSTTKIAVAVPVPDSLSSSNVNISLDEAILESLTEAMATEMRIGPPLTEQDSRPLGNEHTNQTETTTPENTDKLAPEIFGVASCDSTKPTDPVSSSIEVPEPAPAAERQDLVEVSG
ncbi:hypothetical protein F5Y19DRAFT_41862 [Xylariaceae sp. FL1651]|nr:hypothetical protein F5Y19DRAFT_41862 [Xylariaceae sp. FL1651]